MLPARTVDAAAELGVPAGLEMLAEAAPFGTVRKLPAAKGVKLQK
jgi:hypothetical protein